MSYPTTATETAIVAWIASGTGLDNEQVIFAAQGGDRPTGQYVEINPIAFPSQGHDWVDIEDNPDSTLGDGEEIQQIARGVRQLTLSIQCYGGAALGTASPMGRLEQLRAKTALPIAEGILLAGGLGLAEFGSIRPVGTAINSSSYEPRAVAEVRFHVTSEVVELGTFIETVISDGELFF